MDFIIVKARLGLGDEGHDVGEGRLQNFRLDFVIGEDARSVVPRRELRVLAKIGEDVVRALHPLTRVLTAGGTQDSGVVPAGNASRNHSGFSLESMSTVSNSRPASCIMIPSRIQ